MLFDQGQFFPNVDWSKTRAYAMGLGNIYINLKGREGQGIVKPGAEYEALRAEIKDEAARRSSIPKTGAAASPTSSRATRPTAPTTRR